MRSARIPGRGIALALVALTSPTVLLVGCGGNAKGPAVARVAAGASASVGVTGSAPAATETRSPVDRLIAYSACMRRAGVPNFPDPNSKGNLILTPMDKINPGSPQYVRAQSTCERLSPEGTKGNGMTPAQHAKALAAMTRYVVCMRRHSVPMADPFSGPNGGVGISVPRGVDPSSEQYKQADAACTHFLPNAG